MTGPQGRYILMELKKEEGNLTPAQYETLELLQEIPGVEAYAFWPSGWDEIERILR